MRAHCRQGSRPVRRLARIMGLKAGACSCAPAATRTRCGCGVSASGLEGCALDRQAWWCRWRREAPGDRCLSVMQRSSIARKRCEAGAWQFVDRRSGARRGMVTMRSPRARHLRAGPRWRPRGWQPPRSKLAQGSTRAWRDGKFADDRPSRRQPKHGERQGRGRTSEPETGGISTPSGRAPPLHQG